MKKLLSLLTLGTAIVSSGATAATTKFKIESKDIYEGKMLKSAQVYNGFGCNGENKSPQITIKGVPAGAKSLAITAYDPDAPTGSGWWHWIAYNIPVTKTDIASGDKVISQGVIFGKNDFGSYDFGGACPPIGHGKHHYVFTVYALSVEKLDVPADASAALIAYNLNNNSIEKATITALYERKK